MMEGRMMMEEGGRRKQRARLLQLSKTAATRDIRMGIFHFGLFELRTIPQEGYCIADMTLGHRLMVLALASKIFVLLANQ
jgi:hypothetical protein